MATESEALQAATQWAMQTFLFALNLDNTNGPTEVLEQIKIRADNLVARLYAEAVADCGGALSHSALITAFVKRVLAWVVEHRQGK